MLHTIAIFNATLVTIKIGLMAMNKPQVTSILSLKTGRKYIHVALATASLLSTVLKNRMETTLEIHKLFFVHSHIGL